MQCFLTNFMAGFINLAYPRILAAKTSQKNNLHFFEAMKADDCEDFTKEMEKGIKYFTKEDVW